MSGALKGAGIGALSGGIFSGVGELGLTGIRAIAAHSIAGGVLSEIQGGNFGHGFASAGLTKFASLRGISQIKGKGLDAILGRTLIATVVGGTVSKISGGKFSNGARTAAFAHLFNQEGEEYR